MIESNPRTIAPGEEVEIGNSGNKDPEEIACKTSVGLYLFEDNYPYRGDFDFNDAVVQYEIRDYYQSKNRAKQITVQLMATGSHMSNSFGFRDSKGFQPFLSGLKGYRNVYAAQAFEPVGEPVVQTLYGDVVPCLKNVELQYGGVSQRAGHSAFGPRRRLVEVRMAAGDAEHRRLLLVPQKRFGRFP